MVYVKIEPVDDEGPLPPWAAPQRRGPPWAVEVERDPVSGEPVAIKPEPGAHPATLKVEGEPVTIIKEEEDQPPPAPEPVPEQVQREAAAVKAMLARPYRPAPQDGGPVSSRNYAAVEAHGGFGLVDRGSAAGGLHDLLAHVPRGDPSPRFAGLRVGDTFEAVTRARGPPQPLKVRYLTPAKYYAPGRRVTMLGVGVDERAWQLLVVRPATRP